MLSEELRERRRQSKRTWSEAHPLTEDKHKEQNDREKLRRVEHGDDVRKYHREYDRLWYRTPKGRQSHDRQAARLKWVALTHYSSTPPRCACCGETMFEFLTLDHIDGNGAEHKKEIMKQTGWKGVPLYTWLASHGYSKGFQVLCFNCNAAKGQRSCCPHKDPQRHEALVQMAMSIPRPTGRPRNPVAQY